MTKRKDAGALATCSQAGARANTFAHVACPNYAPAGTARHIEDYILPPLIARPGAPLRTMP
eukprot:1895653-Prorocentrum_lima.AAC.1